MNNLGEYIQSAVDRYPDVTALHIRRGVRIERYSYMHMWELSLKCAAYMKRKGLRKGDMVLIWGPNMPEWVIVLFACFLSGIVAVPVSVHASGETADGYMSQTNAKLLFVSKLIKEKTSKDIETVSLENLVDEIADVRSANLAKIKPDDLAEIMYTSGTTGEPSGVMLSHRNILVGLEGLKHLVPPGKEFRLLSILPLSHALEQLLSLLTLMDFGATNYYMARVNPVVILKSLKAYKITHVIVVPQLLKVMWNSIEYRAESEGKLKMLKIALGIAPVLPFASRRLLFRSIHKQFGGRLQMFGCAGAPLDAFIAEKWERLGIAVIEGYGTTETSAAVTANTISDRKLGSVGKIFPGMDMAFSKEGEILVRGDNVSKGYYENPEKTEKSFTKDGYFRTGDIGNVADDGYVYLSGRKQFKIVTPSGEKVYPEDVERVLNQHPAVKESCVVGIDRGKGEIVTAVVILKEDIALEDVLAWANGRLESHQQILGISLWPDDDFPRTRTLKVDRNNVRGYVADRGQDSEERKSALSRKEDRDQIIEIVASVCEVKEHVISDTALLVMDLKLDSLKRVALVSMIEEECGVIVHEEDIDEKTTVGDVRKLVDEGTNVADDVSHVIWPLRKPVVELREYVRRFLLFPLFRIFAPPVIVKGKRNLKAITPPCILYFNHVGHNEGPMIMRELSPAVRKKQAVLADPRSFRSKIRSFWMYFVAAAFPVQKFGGPIRYTLELAADLLDKGWLVFMSPEGERSPDGKLLPFQKGTGVLAVETGVPVYPVKVKGYRRLYPERGGLLDIPKGKGNVTLVFGPPMKFERGVSYEEATKRMRDVIKKM